MINLKFSIDYHTEWGQQIVLCGDHPSLGAWDESRALRMTFVPWGHWNLEIELPDLPESVSYKYGIKYEGSGAIDWEYGENRSFEIPQVGYDLIEFEDSWRARSKDENAWFSSAFTRVIMRPEGPRASYKPPKDNHTLHRFQLLAPRIQGDLVMCLIGDTPELGGWDEKKALVMDGRDYPLWKVDVALTGKNPVSYKYAIMDPRTGKVLSWEAGSNRVLESPAPRHNRVLRVRTDQDFRYPVGNWKGSGLAIPVFSLRSKKGYGVGEFTDLKTTVDWALKAGQKLIQVLPINDTTANHSWTDSYPYASISVFALHPLYLNLDDTAVYYGEKLPQEVKKEGKELNKLPEIDYEAVMDGKLSYLKKLYRKVKKSLDEDKAFSSFIERNHDWLLPYGVFCYLRDQYKTSDFNQWGMHSNYAQAWVEALVADGNDARSEIYFHFFLQFHLDRQLREATEYGRKKGVVMKGDIPIGIYRYSADAWVAPELYHMDKQAGAPPDAFSAEGQNWGFPTYDWAEMAKDGYAWWRRRLTKMAEYFDAFRIDHILGFFRIWEIPMQAVQGLLGYFNPALPFHREEIYRWGIGFDHDRFCLPYIRQHFLEDRFGELTSMVVEEYLDEPFPGIFTLKEMVATQRSIEKVVQARVDLSEDARSRLKNGLYSLAAEVLFIPDDNLPDHYHPRISMQFTRSFQDLDGYTQARLNELYNDFFYRRHDGFWADRAMEKLPAITSATNMLVCGEDLGMVPDSVAGVMHTLGLLGLNIERMPKDPKKEFMHPADAPYLSVVSPSSHDMATVRGWWEEDQTVTQRFFNQMLGHDGGAPYYCEPWIASEILLQHLYSPAMWAIFPLQDLLAMDGDLRRENPHEERINIPANPKHYWRYRMHLTLEDLLKADDFNNRLRGMVDQSGRHSDY